MKGLGLAISMSGMVACAMLFCLACGDLDLSVASVIACSGVVTAVAINATGSVILGVGAGLLSGVAFGLLNGFVIAKLQINALITGQHLHPRSRWSLQRKYERRVQL